MARSASTARSDRIASQNWRATSFTYVLVIQSTTQPKKRWPGPGPGYKASASRVALQLAAALAAELAAEADTRRHCLWCSWDGSPPPTSHAHVGRLFGGCCSAGQTELSEIADPKRASGQCALRMHVNASKNIDMQRCRSNMAWGEVRAGGLRPSMAQHCTSGTAATVPPAAVCVSPCHGPRVPLVLIIAMQAHHNMRVLLRDTSNSPGTVT